MKTKDLRRITLRLPVNLHKGVQKLAAREQRSINSQLIKIVEERLQHRKAA